MIFRLPWQDGLVYAVEFSHRSGRDLMNVAKKRTNIIPIIEDARHPHKYRMLIGECSTLTGVCVCVCVEGSSVYIYLPWLSLTHSQGWWTPYLLTWPSQTRPGSSASMPRSSSRTKDTLSSPSRYVCMASPALVCIYYHS